MAVELEALTPLQRLAMTRAAQARQRTQQMAVRRFASTPQARQAALVLRRAQQARQVANNPIAALNRVTQSRFKKVINRRAAPIMRKARQLARPGVPLALAQRRAQQLFNRLPGGAVTRRAAQELARQGRLQPRTRALLHQAQRHFLNRPAVRKQFARAAAPVRRFVGGVERQLTQLTRGIPGLDGATQQAMGELMKGRVDIGTVQRLGTRAGRQLLDRYGKQFGEKALRRLASKIPNIQIPNVPGVGGIVNAVGQQLLSGNFKPEALARAAGAAGKKFALQQGKKLAVKYGTKAAAQIGGKALASTAASAVPYVGAVASLATSGRQSPNLQGKCDVLEWNDKSVLGLKGAMNVGALRGTGPTKCAKGLPDPRFHMSGFDPRTRQVRPNAEGLKFLRLFHLKRIPHNMKRKAQLKVYKAKLGGMAGQIRKQFPAGPQGDELAYKEALRLAQLWKSREKSGAYGKRYAGRVPCGWDPYPLSIPKETAPCKPGEKIGGYKGRSGKWITQPRTCPPSGRIVKNPYSSPKTGKMLPGRRGPRKNCRPWTRNVFGRIVDSPPYTKGNPQRLRKEYEGAKNMLRSTMAKTGSSQTAVHFRKREAQLAKDARNWLPACPKGWQTMKRPPDACLVQAYINELYCEEVRRGFAWVKACNKKKHLGAIGMMVAPVAALAGGGPILAAGMMAKQIGEQVNDKVKADRNPSKYRFR